MGANLDGEGVELDLLGDPLRPIRDPRGRPSFAKSKENQQLVISLRAAGWTQDQIATFIGADAKTLRKYFSRELDHGALFLEGMAMQVLVKEMLRGNVTATKRVLEIAQAANAPKGKPDAKPERLASVGKKAQLAIDAQRPSQGWGDLVN
jgi:hypothetical protein